VSINVSEIERQAVRARLYYLLIIALGAFAFLVARFYILQIVQYRDWRDFAEIQQIRPSRISPIRGDIYDRHKAKLAGTEPSYNVMVIPQDVTDDAIARLADILGTSGDTLREREKKNRSWWPFKPALVAENIDRQEESLLRVDPPRVVRRQTAGGNNTVNMRMMLEFLVPGVKDAEESDFRTEALRIAGDLQQRLGARAEQQGINLAFVLQGQRRKLPGQGKDHVDVARGQ